MSYVNTLPKLNIQVKTQHNKYFNIVLYILVNDYHMDYCLMLCLKITNQQSILLLVLSLNIPLKDILVIYYSSQYFDILIFEHQIR